MTKVVTKTGEFRIGFGSSAYPYSIGFGYRGYEISRGVDGGIVVFDVDDEIVFDTESFEIEGIIKAVEFIDNLHDVEAIEPTLTRESARFLKDLLIP